MLGLAYITGAQNALIRSGLIGYDSTDTQTKHAYAVLEKLAMPMPPEGAAAPMPPEAAAPEGQPEPEEMQAAAGITPEDLAALEKILNTLVEMQQMQMPEEPAAPAPEAPMQEPGPQGDPSVPDQAPEPEAAKQEQEKQAYLAAAGSALLNKGLGAAGRAGKAVLSGAQRAGGYAVKNPGKALAATGAVGAGVTGASRASGRAQERKQHIDNAIPTKFRKLVRRGVGGVGGNV